MAGNSTPVPEITNADDDVTVTEPLLSPPPATVTDTVPAPSGGRDRASTRVSWLLGFFYSRRGSWLLVRENVAFQIEDWREDWGYSLPFVVLDTLWNLAFVAVSLAMAFWIAREEENVELRPWIYGYVALCVWHVGIVWTEYVNRSSGISTVSISAPPIQSSTEGRSLTRSGSEPEDDDIPSCKAIHTMFYCIWWIVGVLSLATSYRKYGSSCLFWLTVALLAVDVFFLTLYILYVCLLLASSLFCLPFTIIFLRYLEHKARASEADIKKLPKYIYEVANVDLEQPDVRTSRMIPMETNDPDFSTERDISTEEADCCICVSHYEEGGEVCFLRCNHHFHFTCIANWLRVRADCPICKSKVP